MNILEIKLQNFKISETTRFSSDYLPACRRPSCAGCMATEFLHNKGNHERLTKLFL